MPTKILVVDDEPDLQILIRQTLRKKIREKELEFFFAQNGAEALAMLERDPAIEFVLTDINMPVMDGLTLLAELRKLEMSRPLLKAVIVSAYGDIKNIRTAMNRGAFDFLIKPLNFEDLEITFNKTLHELATLKQAMQAHDRLVALGKELSIANDIQQSILPRAFPPFPDRPEIDLYAEMIPAKEVGGDFYDFFLIDHDRLGFLIGDVSGKGVPAAFFMAVSRTLIKATALRGVSPAECLQYANAMLGRENARSMFVTIFYGVLNLRTGEMEYCNAGHNRPFYLRANGAVEALEKVGGLALGLTDDGLYQTKKMTLQPGDSLFLYTDGINEAVDGSYQEFSDHRLQDFLQRARVLPLADMIRGMINEVKTFAAGAPQADDMTALALRYRPQRRAPASPNVAATILKFKNNLAELQRLNLELEQFGAQHRIAPNILRAVNLVLDEVLTNIITYGFEHDGEHEISIRLAPAADALEIEVTDEARAFNPLELPAADTSSALEERAVGGLGVHLVRRLMDTLEYQRIGGKNILVLRKKIRVNQE